MAFHIPAKSISLNMKRLQNVSGEKKSSVLKNPTIRHLVYRHRHMLMCHRRGRRWMLPNLGGVASGEGDGGCQQGTVGWKLWLHLIFFPRRHHRMSGDKYS